jgi:hypothetical protein
MAYVALFIFMLGRLRKPFVLQRVSDGQKGKEKAGQKPCSRILI